MIYEFGLKDPNSLIHSDNCSEFKSYYYKLLAMNFNFN